MSLRRLDAGNRFVHAAVRAVAARQPVPSPPADEAWMQRAGQHGVLSVLAAHLEPAADEQLRSVRQRRTAHHLRTLADLRILQQALGEANLEWLVFKGPVLSEIVYHQPGTRNYGDLDVLIRPGNVENAVRQLMLHGSVPLDPDWQTIPGRGRGELEIVLPHGSRLDLHWHMINDRQVRDSFSLSTAALMSASREIRLGDMSVRTLGAIDTVLHTAYHGAKSGGDRLRWLLDLHQSLSRCDVTPAILLERARLFGLELVLRSMVNRMATFVGDVPVVLPRATLTVRCWLAADALAMSLFPPGSRWQGRLSAAVLARSTRPRAAASWFALAAGAAKRMTARSHAKNCARPTTPL